MMATGDPERTPAPRSDGWIPIPDGPASSGRSATPSERMTQEFLSAPEGTLRHGSLVVRPSLWAALERSLTVIAGLSALFIPFAVGYLLGVDVDEGDSDGPSWIRLLNASQTLLIPLFAAIAPAVQLAFTRYVFDDEGIRERVQIFSKTERRVEWSKVTALRHRHTVLDRVFRLGRVDVIAYGERGTTIRLVGLKRPEVLRNLVAGKMLSTASVEQLFQND